MLVRVHEHYNDNNVDGDGKRDNDKSNNYVGHGFYNDSNGK